MTRRIHHLYLTASRFDLASKGQAAKIHRCGEVRASCAFSHSGSHEPTPISPALPQRARVDH
jgi:hypothetical protein